MERNKIVTVFLNATKLKAFDSYCILCVSILSNPSHCTNAHFPLSYQTKAKALPGERSFDFIQYRHTLSKTSSSGSSYERQPSAEPSSEELLSQLKTKHDEEVTRLTERPSVVEAERDRVTREKEKWRV